jgi:hypothetical protein
VASLREIRRFVLVNSYALGLELRFKDEEDSIIVGYPKIAEFVL